MAYVMTYNSLLEDLRRYLERGFTEQSDPLVFDQLPRLITLAERTIATDLKLQGFIRVVQTPLQVGVAVYRKPDRWRDTVSMRTGGELLLARSQEYCRNYWPDDSVVGLPEFYADMDYQHWLIVPTPSTANTLEISYYEYPRPLDDSNQSNWLTDYAPNLLLYGALLEATVFLKNDERVAVWQQMYAKAATALTSQDSQKVLDRTAVRSEV